MRGVVRFLIAIYILIAPAAAAYFLPALSGLPWLVALSGVFICFLTKFDELAELSFGPVKAKMYQTISRAEEIIEKQKSLAVALTRVTLTDIMASNFFDGISLEQKLDMHDKLLAELASLGVSKEIMKSTEENWNKGIALIYHRIIRGCLRGQTSKRHQNIEPSPELDAVLKEFQGLIDFAVWQAPSPDKVEKFIIDKSLMTQEIRDWINDYRKFIQTGEISRKEQFTKW